MITGEVVGGKVKVKVEVIQSCPSLCDPVDYTVLGILYSRMLGWVAFLLLQGIGGRQREI